MIAVDEPLWSVGVIFYHPDGSHTLCVTWKRAATADDAISQVTKLAAEEYGRTWLDIVGSAQQIPENALHE